MLSGYLRGGEMAIMRIVKQSNFSIVSNSIIRDTRLSLKARGLLILMLSLPDCWQFSVKGLATLSGEGNDSIRGGIKELEEVGYLSRKRKHLPNGRLGEMEYTLYEQAQPKEEKPASDLPTLENPTQEKPIQAKPTQANPTLLSTNIINTDYIKNRERENKELKEEPKLLSRLNSQPLPLETAQLQNEYFKRFWLMYPRKAKQFQAQLAWNALPVDVELYERILQAVEKYSKTRQWADKTYVPYPENFIDGKRWEDDIPTDDVPPVKKKNDVAAAAEAVVAGLEGMW